MRIEPTFPRPSAPLSVYIPIMCREGAKTYVRSHSLVIDAVRPFVVFSAYSAIPDGTENTT